MTSATVPHMLVRAEVKARSSSASKRYRQNTTAEVFTSLIITQTMTLAKSKKTYYQLHYTSEPLDNILRKRRDPYAL